MELSLIRDTYQIGRSFQQNGNYSAHSLRSERYRAQSKYRICQLLAGGSSQMMDLPKGFLLLEQPRF